MGDFLTPYKDLYFGYDITDEAIKHCPSDTKWLLVTNGDNEYSPKTLSYLDEGYDAIGYDYYSRYSMYIHNTSYDELVPGTTSLIYANNHGLNPMTLKDVIEMNDPCPQCYDEYTSSFPDKKDICYSLNPENCFWNGLSPLRTDLGANIWNYRRWQKENRNFTVYSPACCHDGFLATDLIKDGWTVKKVPMCLFSHSPNPWSACRHLFENGYT